MLSKLYLLINSTTKEVLRLYNLGYQNYKT